MGQKPTPLLKPTQKIIFFFKATQKKCHPTLRTFVFAYRHTSQPKGKGKRVQSPTLRTQSAFRKNLDYLLF
jgi:hypothetical protein